MRKFYLVQAGCLYGDTYYLPYAVGMLAAFALDDKTLRQNYALGGLIYSLEDIDTAITAMDNPALVGFSNSIWNYQYNLEFAKKVKAAYPDCVIEFGGHHIPPDSSYLEQYPFIDLLVYGKGEEAFRDILLALLKGADFSGIPNICYRDADGSSKKTVARKIDCCHYPSPYLTGLFDSILSENRYRFSCVLETNRGCPYNCSYCDWGELNSSVRMFPIERVFSELEWMAAHQMEFVYLVDANFGMFPRDEAIAQKIAELKQKSGYPNRLQVSYAKNEPDRVFRINKLLSEHGIGKGATLALQSLNPEVLKNVGRGNISKDEYVRRVNQFRNAGISTYTELIIGLPGETLQSFEEGLCELLELGQHSSVTCYHCELLPGARMSTKQYMEQYGIQTVCTTLDQYHCNDMQNVLSGYSNIVVGTNTMSRDEWIEANFFADGLQGLHHFGLAQCAAMYVRKELGVTYYRFYSELLRFFSETSAAFGAVFQKIRSVLNDFVYNEGPLTMTDHRFGDITWPLEEVVFLSCLYDVDRFYEDLGCFLRAYISDPDLLKDLLVYQKAILVRPVNNGKKISVRYAWRDYFDAILENRESPLQKRNTVYLLETPFQTDNWPEYAKLIVWYGRRNARMLYSSRPNTITEVD